MPFGGADGAAGAEAAGAEGAGMLLMCVFPWCVRQVAGANAEKLTAGEDVEGRGDAPASSPE